MKTFRVAIVGGRDFTDYHRLSCVMDKLLATKVAEGYRIIINNGGARGADYLGGQYATSRSYDMDMFPAMWDTYGKKAGILRNEEMSDSSDAVVAFWDGQSRGTKHMIEYTKKACKPIRVYSY